MTKPAYEATNSDVEKPLSELTGTALDLAVAMATGWNVTRPQDAQIERDGMYMLCGEASKRHSRYVFSPSTDWHQCGELIDFYQIMLCPEAHLGHEGTEDSQRWYADVYYDGGEQFTTGMCDNPLIAACRAIVGMKFGDLKSIAIPSQLLEAGNG